MKVLITLLLAAGTAAAQHPGNQTADGYGFVERLDQDGDGYVSSAEFDGLPAHFSMCDTNGDGFISVAEAPSGPPPRQQSEQQEGQPPEQQQNRPHEQQGGLLARLDLNGDGYVSAEEFDGPAEHFTRLDADGDGYLNESEVPSGPPPHMQQEQQEGQQMNREQGGPRPPQHEGFVARLDLNEDGYVSSGEFDGPADAFAQLDIDGDGYLSEDEAPAGPPPGGRQ